MHQIKFSHNWNNKLEQPFFTTIRRATIEKKKYYDMAINELFEIVLKKNIIGHAVLRSVQLREYSTIAYPLLVLDTGSLKPHDIFAKFNILTSVPCLILIFEKPKKGE